ncbi:molybdopterin-dependent oxidoreductase [Halorussus litoreus]|uniref:molybdopterin-dependent oxidoreductase n=1 Tax=Halorussus litoreus TaxID=1710536 RepID=UPI000E21D199|nr:molybdopterin-dependent oxidoreductase [Halorussus litoreus]
MRNPLEAITVAVAAGVAALAGSYAAAGLTPAFVAAPISDVVVAATPDAVVTWSIQTLGDLGAQLGFLLALALTAGLFAVASAAGAALADRFDVNPSPVVALLSVAVGLALTGALLSTLAAGAAAGLAVAVANWRAGATGGSAGGSGAPAGDGRGRNTRRRVLQALAGAVGIAGAGAVLGSRRNDDSNAAPETDGEVDEEVRTLLDEADGKSLGVEGIEPLVSEQFYQVDINNVDPNVAREDWTLSLTGAVDRPIEFDYDDLTGMTDSIERRFVTLRCVGEGLNGKKMDTALWTGVPVMDLLDEANLNADENCCVMFRAEDDFFEEFPLSALRDGFLAFEMNGEPLPRGHGHPVRALIPGHWGEINVKWLTEIEILEEEADGYWEQRGWHGTGPVETVAKLHTVNHLDGGEIQVGGHAYAGTRGIERVEVSTDGGDSWTETTLSEPLPGTDVWRQWEYTYEADSSHEVVVRATDGEGELQPEEERNAFPSGPTGWVSRRVEP